MLSQGFSSSHWNTLVIKLFIRNCLVIVCFVFFPFVISSDWDGIMERDNHQEGEAQGVKICDPPSESNPPGK